MSKMNKDAKRLRDTYEVKYQTALFLIRTRGLEGAITQCESWKKAREKRAEEKKQKEIERGIPFMIEDLCDEDD